MDLICVFGVFIVLMLYSLVTGITMILPLSVGLISFILLAVKRGNAPGKVLKMAWHGAQESLVVVLIMVLIGCLTALWRMSGTIAYFTDYGIRLIPPRIFILAAFLLASIMSYLLGTSFGVTGTIGVILMTIARASGVSVLLAGGAVLSGVYFGDRGSPAASSASLVANETHTDVTRNIRRMLPSSLIPMLLCAIFYAAVSFLGAPADMDMGLLSQFETEFQLNAWCLAPAALLLVLAFAGMNIKYVMLIDIAFSFVMTLILQGSAPLDILRTMLSGFTPQTAALSEILSGGGVISMLEISVLLLLSSACAGVFEGTAMLAPVEGLSRRLSARIGRFQTMVLFSIASCGIFCNQTIGVIMCRQAMRSNYPDTPEGNNELMLDIENSVITIAGLVPWCIACSVPLKMLGCDLRTLPFAAFLYLVPLCWAVHLKRAQRAQIKTA